MDLHGKATIIKSILRKKNDRYDLIIENNGFFIEEATIESFSNSTNQFNFKKGKSLGLTLIKRILEAHNWKIKLSNIPNPSYLITIPEKDIIIEQNDYINVFLDSYDQVKD